MAKGKASSRVVYPAVVSALLAASGVTKKTKEPMDRFLRRVVAAVEQLSDEQGEKIPEEAQKWYNEAIDAIEAGTDLPPIPGAGQIVKDADGRSRKGAKGKAGGEPKKPTKTPKTGGGGKRAPSAILELRRLIIRHPEHTRKKITELLANKKIDLKRGTIASNFFNTHQTLAAIKLEGLKVVKGSSK